MNLINRTLTLIKPQGDGHVQVILEKSDAQNFIICTLNKQIHVQQQIQLIINAGEQVSFHVKGGGDKAKVHLTGYYLITESCRNDHDGHAHGHGHALSGKFEKHFENSILFYYYFFMNF